MQFSGAHVAFLVTSVVLILPAEVKTAVNKKIEEEEQKMEVGLRSIQQNFAYIARLLQKADHPKKGGACWHVVPYWPLHSLKGR